MLEFGLHRSTFPLKILQQSTPVDLSVENIRWQIAAEWLEVVQWSQHRTYRKPPSISQTIADRTTSPFLDMRVPYAHRTPTSEQKIKESLFHF